MLAINAQDGVKVGFDAAETYAVVTQQDFHDLAHRLVYFPLPNNEAYLKDFSLIIDVGHVEAYDVLVIGGFLLGRRGDLCGVCRGRCEGSRYQGSYPAKTLDTRNIRYVGKTTDWRWMTICGRLSLPMQTLTISQKHSHASRTPLRASWWPRLVPSRAINVWVERLTIYSRTASLISFLLFAPVFLLDLTGIESSFFRGWMTFRSSIGGCREGQDIP